jgi:hypothetical protein
MSAGKPWMELKPTVVPADWIPQKDFDFYAFV